LFSNNYYLFVYLPVEAHDREMAVKAKGL